jgi:hypothetical protein
MLQSVGKALFGKVFSGITPLEAVQKSAHVLDTAYVHQHTCRHASVLQQQHWFLLAARQDRHTPHRAATKRAAAQRLSVSHPWQQLPPPVLLTSVHTQQRGPRLMEETSKLLVSNCRARALSAAAESHMLSDK